MPPDSYAIEQAYESGGVTVYLADRVLDVRDLAGKATDPT